mgnify:CR=1 FL=1
MGSARVDVFAHPDLRLPRGARREDQADVHEVLRVAVWYPAVQVLPRELLKVLQDHWTPRADRRQLCVQEDPDPVALQHPRRGQPAHRQDRSSQFFTGQGDVRAVRGAVPRGQRDAAWMCEWSEEAQVGDPRGPQGVQAQRQDLKDLSRL